MSGFANLAVFRCIKPLCRPSLDAIATTTITGREAFLLSVDHH
jgi:hypothetical protein